MGKRALTVLGSALMIVALLTGCSGPPASPSASSVAPSTVGGWSQVSHEQAFDSGIGSIAGADTTNEWVTATEASYQHELSNLFEGVKFKGGARPRIKELVFYAPTGEKDANAPKHLGVLAITELPGSVEGKAVESAFRSFARNSFRLTETSNTLAYTTSGGNRAIALVDPYEIDASATDRSFVSAYVKFVSPQAKP